MTNGKAAHGGGVHARASFVSTSHPLWIYPRPHILDLYVNVYMYRLVFARNSGGRPMMMGPCTRASDAARTAGER
jgi:hypothetical protein